MRHKVKSWKADTIFGTTQNLSRKQMGIGKMTRAKLRTAGILYGLCLSKKYKGHKYFAITYAPEFILLF